MNFPKKQKATWNFTESLSTSEQSCDAVSWWLRYHPRTVISITDKPRMIVSKYDGVLGLYYDSSSGLHIWPGILE